MKERICASIAAAIMTPFVVLGAMLCAGWRQLWDMRRVRRVAELGLSMRDILEEAHREIEEDRLARRSLAGRFYEESGEVIE